jgi:hypothetical protein
MARRTNGAEHHEQDDGDEGGHLSSSQNGKRSRWRIPADGGGVDLVPERQPDGVLRRGPHWLR